MAVNVKSVETKKTVKTSQKPSSAAASPQSKDVQNFFGDVKAEFKKISWTEKEELKAYTKIVVGATFLCGIGVYGVDLAIRGCLTTFEAIVRLIFG